MGVPKQMEAELYRLGLLHDCGVSSTKVHKKLAMSRTERISTSTVG